MGTNSRKGNVHSGQVRKQMIIPYVAHLLAVAATVLEYDGSEDMAIAGLLRDGLKIPETSRVLVPRYEARAVRFLDEEIGRPTE